MKKLFPKNSVVHSERGAVLVVVLGILALLTVIAVSFVFASRMSLRASEAYLRTVNASDIAEAGMANAIAILEADKIYRMGDPLDSTVPITETYDSLRDSWRQSFSAPVVLTYVDPTNTDAGLNVGDTVVNNNSAEPTRYGTTAKVIGIDRTNKRLYLNCVSQNLWEAGSPGDQIIEENDSFDATISAVAKADTVDLDGDTRPDAIWQNYYDESGTLLGRYAVLVQDESSKININAAGNLSNDNGTAADFTDDEFAASGGWSANEISIQNSLAASAGNANQIVRYRYGAWQGQTGIALPRVYLPGQGDNSTTAGDPDTFDDDDDNYNRYLYAHDGIDNDGDGTIDEANEGLNEPEEFRPLRPVRARPEAMGGGSPLDYDGLDNDSDGYVDETNEADDQPLLTAESLDDDEGIALEGFLNTNVNTNFDGVTTVGQERRYLASTLSHDRNLNKEGRLRVNPNFASTEQILAAVQSAVSIYGTGDNNALERTDLRNMQIASNIYDYRDRNNARIEIKDAAENTFAGVEAVRINEVLVRAATSIYEPEYLLSTSYWTQMVPGSSYGAGTPRIVPGFLRNVGTTGNGTSESDSYSSIILPDPPFTATGGPSGTGVYPFKLLMRVRSNGAAGTSDLGFIVNINGSNVNTASGIYSLYGSRGISSGRWATFNTGTGTNNWYVEEAIVQLNGGGASNSIEFVKPGVSGGSDPQDTVDVDWFYFSQEPDCEWIELVNLSPRTVNVRNWKLVSEYIKDEDETASAQYYEESYEAILSVPAPPGKDEDDEDVGIPPIDSVTDPYLDAPQGTPKYVVFAIDRLSPQDGAEEVGLSGFGSSNGIDYLGSFVGGLWSNIQSIAAVQMVYQLNVTASIYTGWIDFFGNEPLDDSSDNVSQHVPEPMGTILKNIGVGRISLYDDMGRLVDRVTYDAGNVAEGFSSLQRRVPMAFGDRLDSNNRFKTRSFIATPTTGFSISPSLIPYYDYDVAADGDYDDWRPQNGEVGSSSPARSNFNLTSSPYALIKYAALTESGTAANEGALTVGGTVTNSSKSETATIIYLNTTANYFIVDGTTQSSRPAAWQAGDLLSGLNSAIEFIDAGAGIFDWDTAANRFKLKTGGVKNRPLTSPGEIALLPFFNEHLAGVRYPDDADDSGLDTGDIITNTTLDPDEDATIIALDRTENYMVLRGNSSIDFVGYWNPGDAISGGSFTTEIAYLAPEHSVSGDENEYCAVLAYSSATGDPEIGDTVTNTSLTPNETAVITAVEITNSTDGFITVLGDPVNDVTLWQPTETINYDTYSAAIDSVEEVQKTADIRGLADYFTTASIDLQAAAAGIYSESTGYTEVNWPGLDNPKIFQLPVSSRLRIGWNEDTGIQEGTYDLYSVVNGGTEVDDEMPLYHGTTTVQKLSPLQQAMLIMDFTNTGAAAAEYHFMRAVITPPPYTFGRINVNTASQRVLQGLPGITDSLATSIIRARNIAAFESIGDVYRVSEIDFNFTPEKFKNISNLITTRSDAYRIIVVGQGATDTNGDGIVQSSEVISEKKLEMIYQR